MNLYCHSKALQWFVIVSLIHTEPSERLYNTASRNMEETSEPNKKDLPGPSAQQTTENELKRISLVL